LSHFSTTADSCLLKSHINVVSCLENLVYHSLRKNVQSVPIVCVRCMHANHCIYDTGCTVQAGLILCQDNISEKCCTNRTQNFHLKQWISWGLRVYKYTTSGHTDL